MQINNWQWQDFELVNSTNDIAIKNSPIFKEQSFIISAKMQTNARGRLGRTWQSLEGNLFVSLAFPLGKIPLNTLPFILSLSLLKTIKAMLLGCSLKELDEREKRNEKNNIKRT